MALNIQRLNFDPVTGDNASEAFMKLDLDIAEIAEAIDGDGTPGTGIGTRLSAVETIVDGLGDAATKNVGTAAGTVAAGNDSRLRDVGTTAGTVAAGDDSRSGDLDTKVTAAQGTANAAQTAAGTANTALTATGWSTAVTPSIASLDGVNRSAIYHFIDTTPGTHPTNQAYGTLLTLSYSASDFTQLATSVTSNEIAFRFYRGAGGGWNAWNRVWHTGNTTVDANLFIKKAN
ncbi:pyocin knob domain-containing protein [Luteibacter sp. NPDC031894]|uniref:pyocin knob domain-containing protein n=1 Tax=Luteibacter sp. NPDC031894 TaxID=3390572 RepID=UPI003D094E1E